MCSYFIEKVWLVFLLTLMKYTYHNLLKQCPVVRDVGCGELCADMDKMGSTS